MNLEKKDRCRVAVCNPGTAGIGVNMVESSYSFYYSKNFNLGHLLQSEARNYRAGSERHPKITHVHLCASGTIDEEIISKLQGKEMTALKILDLIEETK